MAGQFMVISPAKIVGKQTINLFHVISCNNHLQRRFGNSVQFVFLQKMNQVQIYAK